MRIAFISSQFDAIRGGSSLFGDLFSVLGGRHDITVFTREDRYVTRHWKTVHVASRSATRFAWLADILFARAAVRRVLELHAHLPFDIILINQTAGAALKKLSSLGIPVLYVIHHPISVDRELALEESVAVAERIRWSLLYGMMVRTQAELARLFPVLTVSETSAERIRHDYHVQGGAIHIIVNGVDTEFYRKTALTEPRTVLAVGSYQHPRRGFTYLLEAYRQLTHGGYTVLDAGRRTDEQDIELKAIPGVTSLGLIRSREDMRELYSRAAVLISTSLYEGFGLSVAEALACGTPVAAFDVGGLRELLGAVDSGMLCPARDVDALVTTAMRYAQTDDMQTGQRLRFAVTEKFSLSRMAQEYEALFEQLTVHRD